MRHGAAQYTRERCSQAGCTSQQERKSLYQAWCIGAENEEESAKDLPFDGCTNQVQKGGVCMRHGASYTKKTCSREGCTNLVQKGKVCIRHGVAAMKNVQTMPSREEYA